MTANIHISHLSDCRDWNFRIRKKSDVRLFISLSINLFCGIFLWENCMKLTHDLSSLQRTKNSSHQLKSKIEIIGNSPIMSGLLNSISGLLAILDENREIISLNDTLLNMLGIDDGAKALGLRTGEILKCVNSETGPDGCGTSQNCQTCGKAIAIVSSLDENMPKESVCVIHATRRNKPVDLMFQIRSNPIEIDGTRFLLLFLQDISLQHHRAAIERLFFHDIKNLLNAQFGAIQLMMSKHSESKLMRIIHHSSQRLLSEIEMQRELSQNERFSYSPVIQSLKLSEMTDELRSFFSNHPEATGKTLRFHLPSSEVQFRSDPSLLLRILTNMIINSLEATAKTGMVEVSVAYSENSILFTVWNKGFIQEHLRGRIFQRNFSTKAGSGRGIGTYSMKLFGEQILGGEVGFTSSEAKGTSFFLRLPI